MGPLLFRSLDDALTHFEWSQTPEPGILDPAQVPIHCLLLIYLTEALINWKGSEFPDLCAFDHLGPTPGIMWFVHSFIYRLRHATDAYRVLCCQWWARVGPYWLASSSCAHLLLISDDVLVVWNRPQWEYLLHINWHLLNFQGFYFPSESLLTSIPLFTVSSSFHWFIPSTCAYWALITSLPSPASYCHLSLEKLPSSFKFI